MTRQKAKNKSRKNLLFPSESVVFKTRLPGEQAMAKLAESIEPEKPFSFRSFIKPTDYSKYTIRAMQGNRFEIIKPFVYVFAMSLTIDGIIHEDCIGTKIYVKMKLDPMFNTIYMSVISIAAIVFVINIISMIVRKEHFSLHDFKFGLVFGLLSSTCVCFSLSL